MQGRNRGAKSGNRGQITASLPATSSHAPACPSRTPWSSAACHPAREQLFCLLLRRRRLRALSPSFDGLGISLQLCRSCIRADDQPCTPAAHARRGGQRKHFDEAPRPALRPIYQPGLSAQRHAMGRQIPLLSHANGRIRGQQLSQTGGYPFIKGYVPFAATAWSWEFFKRITTSCRSQKNETSPEPRGTIYLFLSSKISLLEYAVSFSYGYMVGLL